MTYYLILIIPFMLDYFIHECLIKFIHNVKNNTALKPLTTCYSYLFMY